MRSQRFTMSESLRLESKMKLNGFLLVVALATFVEVPRTLPAADKKDAAATPVPQLSDAEKENFLKTGAIKKTYSAKKGVTNTTRVTMMSGDITHDAHVQCIDEAKHEFKTDRGTELNFKDTFKFNIAAYRLSRMLGIENIPVTVERKVAGKTCAVDWWVDDVMMDEATRKSKKMEAPNPEGWNSQIYVMRVFDQLIYNVDRNLTNLLILKNWDIEMIDHSRSFRLAHTLENPKNLGRIDRTLLENLRKLDKAEVQKALMPFCTKSEVESLMARRDVIVAYYDKQVKEKGETAVVYDLGKIKPIKQ
jgi:hypothetical protein